LLRSYKSINYGGKNMLEKPEPIHTPWWSDVVMYWLEDQITIAFHTDLPATKATTEVIDALHLENLRQYLKVRGYELLPFEAKYTALVRDTVEVSGESGIVGNQYKKGDINNPLGKYFFASPANRGTTVIAYFRVEPTEAWDGQSVSMGGGEKEEGTYTQQVISLLNHNLEVIRQDVGVPILSATANWFGNAGCFSHGGPALPPFPVPGDAVSNDPGNWHITFPQLSSSPIASKTGKGITVFVLDTLPLVPGDAPEGMDIITWASNQAGEHNRLLQKMAKEIQSKTSPSIKLRYIALPDFLATDAPDQMVTGRDIHGKKHAFHMVDHGLFVAGIVRELAPEADIECVRVLNDFGVGDCGTLIAVLEWIHGRMSEIDPATGQVGDLYKKPVVINLSLVMTPSDEELFKSWFGSTNGRGLHDPLQVLQDMRLMRAPLHRAIQNLAASGAVIIGAAGNDSFAPYMPRRIGPRYPAAFPEVISVGAVDRDGNMAPYSNYPQLPPQHNGIATYGGSVPRLSDIQSGDVDAVIGVYCSPTYPPLEAKNPASPNYPAPNPNAWAYWSGTSFATPIVSGLAARVLEHIQPQALPARHVAAEVQWALTTAAGQQATLGVVLDLQPQFEVSLLKAEQSHPVKQEQKPLQEAVSAPEG
jgi:hypothetical protein